MSTLIIIGGVNVNNDTLIPHITGEYGYRGADKVVMGSQGTERSIDLGSESLDKWFAEDLESVRAMIGGW